MRENHQNPSETLIEARLRVSLLKMGYLLGRSHAKNPDHPCFGLYNIIEMETGASIGSRGILPYELSLDEVEKIAAALSGEGEITPEMNQFLNARSGKHRYSKKQ